MRWLLLALLGPLAAHAQGIDMTKGGPVEVTSERRHGAGARTSRSSSPRATRRRCGATVTVTADRSARALPQEGGCRRAGDEPCCPGSRCRDANAGRRARTPRSGTPDTGNNEIYRLEAEGQRPHLHRRPTRHSATMPCYDIDQAVLVMTGHDLHIITPQQTMSARDTMEYWSQKHMAVGRGNAVVNTSDGRRLSRATCWSATPRTPTRLQPQGSRRKGPRAARSQPPPPRPQSPASDPACQRRRQAAAGGRLRARGGPHRDRDHPRRQGRLHPRHRHRPAGRKRPPHPRTEPAQRR